MNLTPEQRRAILTEVAAIATTAAATITERARAVLTPLRRLVPFDAAWIALLDPERRQQVPLVRLGYDAKVQEYLDSTQHVDDVERTNFHRYAQPMRVKDFPIPAGELPVWAEHLRPAGFGEGIAVSLRSGDGRYVGVLTMNTETTTPVPNTSRDLLGALAPLLAYAVDPMRTITPMVDVITTAIAGTILTHAGNTEPLPGLPDDPLLRAGSAALLEAATLHASGIGFATFLIPDHRRDDPHGYQRVTMMACPTQPRHHLAAIVLLSPTEVPHNLTRRQLTMLGMLIDGWEPQRIGTALQLSPRTVIDIIEQIRATLGAPTREATIIRAAGQGLYLPLTHQRPRATRAP